MCALISAASSRAAASSSRLKAAYENRSGSGLLSIFGPAPGGEFVDAQSEIFRRFSVVVPRVFHRKHSVRNRESLLPICFLQCH